MLELDPKVKDLLDKLTILNRRKAAAVSVGLLEPMLDVEIKVLMGALRMIEGFPVKGEL